jgi:tetratricopeptide (TPR) repeat protein
MDRSLKDRFVCPNCGALHAPNAHICVGCGVNIDEYRHALPEWKNYQERQEAAHQDELAEIQADLMDAGRSEKRKLFGLQLKYLIIAGILLMMTTLIIFSAAGYQTRLRRERLAEIYAESLACLKDGNFLCARDGLIQVVHSSRRDEDVIQYLALARLGLAGQYARSGKWSDAIQELDLYLETNPGDESALALMENVYNRWLADAIARGNVFEVWRVQRQRDAIFPPH